MRHAACRTLALLCAVIWSVAAFAQAPDATAKWTVTNKKVSDNVYELTFVGRIADGWHIYPVDHKYTPVSVDYPDKEGLSAGKLVQVTEPVDFQGQKVFFDQVTLKQEVTVKGNPADIHGEVSWSGCNDEFCAAPEYWEFRVPLSPPTEGREAAKKNKGLWGLIIEAILWGFAMLLTPCVFPMVPMTISYFMKQSDNVVQGRFKAFMYGLFIILLYTVPICLIIGLTWLIGGNSITADIFNWLATHWLPNILFFVIFMVFAASFFGAFEIELPSSLANKSDAKSSSKGLSGIFFMALTLVLVSFSCTGPIVGTVLIKSTAGEFWTPMVTMLAFSIAFALPFTILALFPSILKKLKSGSWLNSVKVVLGFIEVALGFKFLSVADQTYHWGILDREVYLAIWIVVFSLLGLYLLGKIRFKNDSPVEHISVTRLALAITVFSFVVYMVPGMWGAPLKALSGYLPPIETQDFVVWSNASAPGGNAEAAAPASYADRYNLRMPMGFTGYFTLEEGLEAAKDQGKPVFVDITGHGCVNCREMEQRVWTDPRVQKIMKEDYVLVVLYNDDKTKLKEEDWVTTGEGKVLKEIGRANPYLVRSRFDVNAQPNYALLGSDGGLLVPVRGYNLSVEGFIDFLESGLEQFRKQQ
ncbi:MAG: thioredoxin family protein [Bacteroidales bacterium]|nr:thioredoxin family protein [Bacteroidales bacterium]